MTTKTHARFLAFGLWTVAVATLLVCCTSGCNTLGNDTLDLGPVHLKGDTLARGADLARPGSGKAVKGVFAGSKALFGSNTPEDAFELAAPDTFTITDAAGRTVAQPITITRTRTLKPIVRTVDLAAQVQAADQVDAILSEIEAARGASNAVERIINSGILEEVP